MSDLVVINTSNLRNDVTSDGKRKIVAFEPCEVLLSHGIVQRIDFSGKRCNLTLKNTASVKQTVSVKVYVLNRALIQIWTATEKWSLKSLQPDESHTVSWEFNPSMSDLVWNNKARDLDPYAVVVDW